MNILHNKYYLSNGVSVRTTTLQHAIPMGIGTARKEVAAIGNVSYRKWLN
jgi:hypothetical protein